MSCFMLPSGARDCLTNRSSTALVTKRRQYMVTHLGGRVSRWQLRRRTHTFARCDRLYLFNVQQSFSQANENLLWFEAGGLQLWAPEPSPYYQRASGFDEQISRYHHPQEKAIFCGNGARVKVLTIWLKNQFSFSCRERPIPIQLLIYLLQT